MSMACIAPATHCLLNVQLILCILSGKCAANMDDYYEHVPPGCGINWYYFSLGEALRCRLPGQDFELQNGELPMAYLVAEDVFSFPMNGHVPSPSRRSRRRKHTAGASYYMLSGFYRDPRDRTFPHCATTETLSYINRWNPWRNQTNIDEPAAETAYPIMDGFSAFHPNEMWEPYTSSSSSSASPSAPRPAKQRVSHTYCNLNDRYHGLLPGYNAPKPASRSPSQTSFSSPRIVTLPSSRCSSVTEEDIAPWTPNDSLSDYEYFEPEPTGPLQPSLLFPASTLAGEVPQVTSGSHPKLVEMESYREGKPSEALVREKRAYQWSRQKSGT